MHFLDVAKDLSRIYPQAGLLVASPPPADSSPPCLQVVVLSQMNGKAVAIALVESAPSLEDGPQARWHWFSLLGLPLDVFVPASRVDDARRLADGARLHIRGFFPWTPGATPPTPSQRQHLRSPTWRPAAVTGAMEAAGALAPARPLVASAPRTRSSPVSGRTHGSQ